jgi:hypothetical protein
VTTDILVGWMENKYPVFKKFDPPFLEKIKKNKRKIKSFVFKGLCMFFFSPGLRPGKNPSQIFFSRTPPAFGRRKKKIFLQMKGIKASIPEPPPVPRGIIVPDALLAFIETTKHIHDGSSWEVGVNLCKLSELVKERNAFGIAKYGQPLYSEDGRNGIEDARQELGDLLQYVFKISLQKERQYTVQEKQDLLNMIKTAVVLMGVLLK